MGQPIKNLVDYERSFSKEMGDLLVYINEDYIQTYPVNEITTEMFFSAALSTDSCILFKIFNGYLNSIALSCIQNRLLAILQTQTITALKPGRKIDYSKELKNLFSKSLAECEENDDTYITTDHVLLALLNTKNGNEYAKVKKIFNEQGINYSVALERSKKIHELASDINDNRNETPLKDLLEQKGVISIEISGKPDDLKHWDGINGILGSLQNDNEAPKKGQKDKSRNAVQSCINLNEEAKNGKIDRLIGRDKEINRIINILNRRHSNNVLLIGDSGCGKTSIVNGIAKKIVDGVAPSAIADYTILKLNTSELIAGTQLRGLLEEKMVNLHKELKKKENSILFIDDFHTFFNEKKDDDYNLLSLLLPFLEDNDLKIIVATTYKGFKGSIEKKQDILSRFVRIDVSEPTMDECKKILSTAKKTYEKYHNVYFNDDIIELILNLCKRYVTKKTMLCAALDIIDEVGAKKQIELLETEEVTQKRKELEEAYSSNDGDKIDSARLELVKLLNGPKNYKNIEINQEDVYSTFSEYENIPISKLNVSEKQQISKINEILQSVIIGQDKAIEIVSRAIKRNKVGLSSHTRPLAVFLLVGKTGVGKTLLAKMLAKEIYCDEKNLVRFDMSEYADKTAVNKFIGSSAGYVGYSEGGLLTEAIKAKKHCVLLFDEIEKANEEVFNLFLQIFDEGFLTDNTGQKVDFRDTIILLTSNVGTKMASETRSIGFVDNVTEKQNNVIEQEIKRKFQPEFLNRLDDIVYFNALTDDDLKKIIGLELKKLKNRLKEVKYDIQWDDGTVDFILETISQEKEYGARPIIRSIQDNIENKITDMILENDYSNGEHVFIIKYNTETKDITIE